VQLQLDKEAHEQELQQQSAALVHAQAAAAQLLGDKEAIQRRLEEHEVQLAAAQEREAALRTDKESMLQQLRSQAQTLAVVKGTEEQLWQAMDKIKMQKQACVQQMQVQEEQLAQWQAQASALRTDSGSYQQEVEGLQRQVRRAEPWACGQGHCCTIGSMVVTARCAARIEQARLGVRARDGREARAARGATLQRERHAKAHAPRPPPHTHTHPFRPAGDGFPAARGAAAARGRQLPAAAGGGAPGAVGRPGGHCGPQGREGVVQVRAPPPRRAAAPRAAAPAAAAPAAQHALQPLAGGACWILPSHMAVASPAAAPHMPRPQPFPRPAACCAS
jgi:hypothetical protein